MIEHGQRAAELAEQESDVDVEVFGRLVAGRAYLWMGRPTEAFGVLDPVASKFDGEQGWDIEVLGKPIYAEALALRADMHAWRGELIEARAFAERLSARLRRPLQLLDLSHVASERIWTWLAFGDTARLHHDAVEALTLGERFGDARNIVYALTACGVASAIASRWHEAEDYLQRAEHVIARDGAGREWTWCIRVLRRGGGMAYVGEMESCLARGLSFVERLEYEGYRPFFLLERAALSRLRGDREGMAGDLTEARRVFAKLGVTGWDDYARSIEV